MPGTTYVLNFGHTLSREVMAQLFKELGECVQVRVPYKVDMGRHPAVEVERIAWDANRQLIRAGGGGLDGTSRLVVVLPGFTEGTALLLAELTGRLGYMPEVLTLRRSSDGTYGLRVVSVDESVIDLERVRRDARGRR